MRVERASRVVGHVVDLDERARANDDTYTTARKVSDGLEQGFSSPLGIDIDPSVTQRVKALVWTVPSARPSREK
jgi:hypothetical protein